jgi:uncharacterized protein
MRLLLDTNIFLEIALAQEKAEEAAALLRRTSDHTFFMSDFSLHSMGVLLFRLKRHGTFLEFVEDMASSGIQVITLPEGEMNRVAKAAESFNLDFDDAYQYAVAQRSSLTIVSFDSDFDRTDSPKKTPAQVG